MNQFSKFPSTLTQLRRSSGLAAWLPVLAAILGVAPAIGADNSTDISNQPLATLPTVHAPPNLLFVMDASGSMDSQYMPDDMSDASRYGYYAAQCNGVAYDPSQTYTPPIDSTGALYPAAPFKNAPDDGYVTGGSTTDLSNSSDWGVYYKYKGTQTPMGWTYTSSSVITSTTFYKECHSRVGSSPGSGVFTAVTVSPSSTEAQNYANWYSYYRKRYLMMRTAMGRAINKLDSSYNVGFTIISESSAKPGTTFRDVKPFTAAQKVDFYSSLYAALPSGNTPLRPGLAKAGQYFADKAPGQTYDPVQYACQRNYALLSTDGYWNTGLETSTYGPFKLDNKTSVGEQDGTELSPMKDSTVATTTTVTTYTGPATRSRTATQTATIVWTRTGTIVDTTRNGSNTYNINTVTQTYTETKTNTGTTPQSGTASYDHTVVNVDGTNTSTTDSAYTYANWADSGTTAVALTGDTGPPGTWTTKTTKVTGTTSTKGTSGNCSCTTSQGTQSAWSGWSTSNFGAASNGTMVAGTPNASTAYSGGDSNTLADVAEYYYNTDLRNKSLNNCNNATTKDTRDLCQDIVPSSGTDTQSQQHMNTFTIGLGVNGTLPNTAATLASLKAGTLDWPSPAETSNGGNATNVDDLWHAALNGRGNYYSALNATALSDAINGVVNTIVAITGSGSSAATSSLQLVAGNNNQLYKASYTTGSWVGDVQAYTLNGDTATVSTTAQWSAQSMLDNMIANKTARKIWFNGGSGSLVAFTYSALNTAGLKYFDNMCSQTPQPTQCATLSDSDKAVANSGSNLVSYLAGANSYESIVTSTSGGLTITSAAVYRKRDHTLGDIIDGAPVYVGKPPFTYADAGYADFVSQKSARKPVVYAAANDGMLHAFSADTTDGGTELWAYVPTAVMPNLYKLASTGYAQAHQYYVDGAPTMGDVKSGSNWKTILVGGFNDGGKGYYALDITDPANPALLWEFTNVNLGFSYGNPVITKRADGTWVVVFGSGYNNNGTGADGNGHLFVLNAITGAKLLDIPTNAGSPATAVGSTSTPSGLAKINAWIENSNDNTATRFYGGDLLGNVWRFDVDNLVQPNQKALQLATLLVGTTPQPITTRPETVAVGTRAVVVVATGRYLGSTDVADTSTQSLYGIADNLDTTTWGTPRTSSAFIKQTLSIVTPATDPPSANITDNAVDFTNAAVGGWWVDLPNSGERVFTNMDLQFNTLAVSSAIPVGDACTSGGSSWRYYIDVTNGGTVINDAPAGQQWNSTALIVGMSWVRDASGNTHVIYQDSKGNILPDVPPGGGGTPNGNARRTSWRELSN